MFTGHVADCYKFAGRQRQNFCLQSCCAWECVEVHGPDQVWEKIDAPGALYARNIRKVSSASWPVAVLRWGQPPPRESCGPPVGCTPIKLVARLHNSCIHSVTSHSCSVKLLHSLNHTWCHSEFLAPPPKYRCGHPKLMQLETPLVMTH